MSEHQEQLAQALSGPHGNIVSGVVSVLEQLNMNSAGKLLAYVQPGGLEHGRLHHEARGVARSQRTIGRVRESADTPVISDPLPPALNLFFTIKQKLFSNSPVNAAAC